MAYLSIYYFKYFYFTTGGGEAEGTYTMGLMAEVLTARVESGDGQLIAVG